MGGSVDFSDDYQPGLKQWGIGFTSLFLLALQLAPSKDNFYSTTRKNDQPKLYYCKRKGKKDCAEPCPLRQLTAAVLSTGPVMIGDFAGHTDREMLMRSCRKDGRLLQPDFPAIPIDDMYTMHGFNKPMRKKLSIYRTSVHIPMDTVRKQFPWPDRPSSIQFGKHSLSTEITSKMEQFGTKYHYFSVLELKNRYSLALNSVLSESGPFLLFEDSLEPILVSKMDTLELEKLDDCEVPTFTLAPILPNGWTLLGEASKLLPMSKARVSRLWMKGDDAHVEVIGVKDEIVEFKAVNPENTVLTTSCVFSSDGRKRILLGSSDFSCF